MINGLLSLDPISQIQQLACEEDEVDEVDRLIDSMVKRKRDDEDAREHICQCKKVYADINPKDSCWYINYILQPRLAIKKFHCKFRRRFRLPYREFLELVDYVSSHNIFSRWHPGKTDAIGSASSPIELLVLGALRYLGRGFTFDDLEEVTLISEEVHRVFFHKFIEYGSTFLYSKYVSYPKTTEDCKVDK